MPVLAKIAAVFAFIYADVGCIVLVLSMFSYPIEYTKVGEVCRAVALWPIALYKLLSKKKNA